MKMRFALVGALFVAAAVAPAGAHHLDSRQETGYLAFWSGVQSPAGVDLSHPQMNWQKAFLSKYAVIGFDFPVPSP